MITMLPYWILQIFPELILKASFMDSGLCCWNCMCSARVLIGRLYGSNVFGFLGSLPRRVTHGYYIRTLAGYYDTDMFSITIHVFALYFSAFCESSEIFKLCIGCSLNLEPLSFLLRVLDRLLQEPWRLLL